MLQEDLKKKQRAARFGVAVPVSKEEFEERKKARAQRFGAGPAAEAMKAGLSEENKKKLEERAKRWVDAWVPPGLHGWELHQLTVAIRPSCEAVPCTDCTRL